MTGNGTSEAQYQKALDLLENGNLKQAYTEFEKAVQAGHIRAHTALAEALCYGMGAERDITRAVELYRIAAETDCNACFALYELHGDGVSLITEQEAANMLEKAAVFGHKKAMAILERK